jgi:hypothetical protein
MFMVLTSAIIGWGYCPLDKRTFYHKIILKEMRIYGKNIRDFFRTPSKSNFVDTGDHRESPLQAFVGAGLCACPKILFLSFLLLK